MPILSSRLRAFAVLLAAFSLVSCGGSGSDGASGANNAVPVANAGADQTVDKNAVVTLDGSASDDADNDSLAYTWTQTGGPSVSLSSSTAARPTFTAPRASGEVTFSVVVSDGKAKSPADAVTVHVHNRAPSVHAGGDQPVSPGASTTLDASGSTDPDGDDLTYTWEQISGPPVIMTVDTEGRLSFTAPAVPGTLKFVLTVSDGETTTTLTVTITVVVNNSNQPPVAMTYGDLETGKRGTVLLQGYGYDPDNSGPLTYAWEQISGPPVTLENATSDMAYFIAPDQPTELKFALRVSDGTAVSTPAQINVSVRNYGVYISNVLLSPQAPRTNDDLTVTADVFDGDGDPITLSYEWRRNGAVVSGVTGATFPASETTKNDVIDVTISATDGDLTSTEQASVTIEDSPATISASAAPADVAYGDTVDFVVTASDADGDPIGTFEVAHGPAGFSVTPQGRVTWTASGPLFDKVMDFNWGVTLEGDPQAILAGTFHVTDATRQYPLRRTGIRIPVQHDGLLVSDLDGDGDQEALIASWDTLYELGMRNGEYEQSWVYPLQLSTWNDGIHAIAAGDLDGDHKAEIIVSTGASLLKLDGVDRREVQRTELEGECRSMRLADLDRDGAAELICLTADDFSGYDSGRLVVRDAGTLAVKWETEVLQLGRTLAVGNVDNDAALEIVTAGGFVFDGVSHENQWAYAPGFGVVVDTGDLDADGVQEIVGAEDWVAVRVYDARIKSPRTELPAPSFPDFDTLRVADIDGDARAEIIVGGAQGSDVIAYRHNPITGTTSVLFQLGSQEAGVSSVGVGDLDGDGAKEIIWGSGAGSSGRDVLVVAGRTPVAQIEWTSGYESQLDGPFFGGGLARIDAQVTPRLMFGSASTQSGYAGMNILAMDPVSGYVIQSGEISSNFGGLGTLDVIDYDGDDQDEIFLCTAEGYSGYFAAYNFLTRSTEWESARDVGSGVAVTHADITGDGYDEFVSITGEGYVYVYDVRNQVLVWKSTQVGDGGTKVAVADVDDDDELDIIAATGSRIVVFGKPLIGTGYVEKATLEMGGTRDLLVADTDGDGKPEIHVLSSVWIGGGGISVITLDGELQSIGSIALEGSASSIYLEASSSLRKNIVVSEAASDDDVWTAARIKAYDPRSGSVVWQSPVLPASVPINSLQYVDADGDGDLEISYATHSGMNVTR